MGQKKKKNTLGGNDNQNSCLKSGWHKLTIVLYVKEWGASHSCPGVLQLTPPNSPNTAALVGVGRGESATQHAITLHTTRPWGAEVPMPLAKGAGRIQARRLEQTLGSAHRTMGLLLTSFTLWNLPWLYEMRSSPQNHGSARQGPYGILAIVSKKLHSIGR